VLKDNVIITDIGSTTTKSLLLRKEDRKYKFVDYETAYTTVERPNEDVKIGLYNSIKKLEVKLRCKIMQENSNTQNISFLPNYTFLATSSAGGGLQILVMGLTKAESATSAEKAAYGVGGVLLDTLAIDDKRSVIEKMKIFNSVHPDIILFCGGADGGALFSVYRLAEILKLANPTQKFSENPKLPLVYAGNKEAVDFISLVFKSKFDLHIVPNLRPSLLTENLEPTKDKIHDLFMNNVMEQAPGYSQIKKIVASDIIPTPSGVLKTIKILGKVHKFIISFDIGGATTDIFSNIDDLYHRTVSANFGMSYSIGNILAESDFLKDFDPYIDALIRPYSQNDNSSFEEYFINYIGNKILYPGFNPIYDIDIFIEHLLAIQGITLSMEQHFKMYFKYKRIGFLDKLKNMASRDKFKEAMYYPHYDKSLLFSKSDIEIAIGAGGVVTNATKEQALFILIESVKPEGICELWRDRYFISPHLGILSDINEIVAEDLIMKECFEKLAIYVKPLIKKDKKNARLLTIKTIDDTCTIKSNEVFKYVSKKTEKIRITYTKNCSLSRSEILLEKGILLIIDTRTRNNKDKLFKTLKPYNFSFPLVLDTNNYNYQKENISQLCKQHTLLLKLPYPGNIFVNPGDIVEPDTLIGENALDPPKLYVVLISAMIGKTFTEVEIYDGLLVKLGDKVSTGDKIFSLKNCQSIFSMNDIAFSPVRGIVETINYATGTIILREIQDYPLKPIKINISKEIGIKDKYIKGYMKKQKGDFVYAGEILATNHSTKFKSFTSPYTGTIQEIDTKKGSITICYDKKPYKLFSYCFGEVTKIIDNKDIYINTEAIAIEGRIGFGQDIGGYLGSNQQNNLNNCIIYQNHVTIEDFITFTKKRINGLICNTVSYNCLKKFLNKDIGVALTGNEIIPFSLIIMKKFSQYELNEYKSDTNLYDQKLGKYVSLKPFTQIRAGASRPTVFIGK